MEETFTVLRREQLLIDRAPHSLQFQDLTGSLLRVCSVAAVIPPMTAEEIRLYAALALLHDVGKRAIPQEILNKPGSLTKEEFEVMKSHTTQGCDLLERVADAFDALIHPQVYKPAYPPNQARDMIVSGACGIFDPLLLACFAQNIGAIYQAVYAPAC